MKQYFAFCVMAGLCTSLSAQQSLLDTNFNPGTGAAGGIVEAVAIQPDNKILICGNFTSFAGEPQHYIARLETNGTLDASFHSDVGYWVRDMGLQADGKIVIGGFFNDVEGVRMRCVARLNADGSLDRGFDPGRGCEGKIVPVDPTEPFVFTVAVQSDGKILIGGNFTTINGVGRNGIARLNTDGSVDTSFDPGSGVNSWVRSLVVEGSGQILMSGWFTIYNNMGHNRVVRLNPDGSVDPALAPFFGDLTSVYTMAPLPDGKILAGGHSVNPQAPFLRELERLNPDGSFDTSFNPNGSGANDKVEKIVIQPDGKILIGGYFNRYNDNLRLGLARLNADGTLDATFAPQTDSWVFDVALQSDGRVLFGGGFNLVDGVARSGVGRVYGSEPPPPPSGPVLPIPGTYNGLFFDPATGGTQSAGALTMRLASNGVFSGKITLNGGVNAFAGRFDDKGRAEVSVKRKGKSTLTNSMVIQADQIQGTVSDGSWASPLTADIYAFSKTNKAAGYAGQYTLALPGGDDPTTSPGGAGYGLVTIDTLGNVRLTGAMADGTSMSQSAVISKDGTWPFYVPLYSGKGVAVGWLSFNNQTSSPTGNLLWLRPATARSTFYKNGFTNQIGVAGSRYTLVKGTRVLDLPSGVVTLDGGNMVWPVTNSFALGTNNSIKIDRFATNRLRLTLDVRRGLVQGSFLNPTTRKSATLRGVVLQSQAQALGYFLGTSQSGGLLMSVPPAE